MRTRMSYVQEAEHGFEEKRQHCSTSYALNCRRLTVFVDIKVVKAFESALALLAET